MSPKKDHWEKAYELLRKSDFYSPFTFPGWQMDKKYMSLREKLREQKYTVKDTGIASRIINNWENKQLMPEGVLENNRQRKGGWRTFSLVEIAWLKVVSRLRKFGFSLEQILAVKSQVIHWNKKFRYYPSFDYCIAGSLFSPKETYLQVLADGTANLVSAGEIEMSKLLGKNEDMLLVSIKSILAELGLDFPRIASRLELSDEEVEMLNEIREGKISEIKGAIKGGKLTQIETSQTSTEPLSDNDLRAEAESDGMFGRVTTQYEGGKKKSTKIVRRKRFDKK